MRILGCLFFTAVVQVAAAQAPQVPHKMQFADLTLTIRDDARREIQKDVDALTQSPKHFNIKVERAKTYFPVIEKVFREEGVPEDFKFLVLQESALIADAVSVSNAVGFWQFKDFTAMEMGLRVDKEIDERLNIVSSSRAAARYIKKNNTFFNNWLFALQAYQMGAGGVMRSVKDSHSGLQHMEITSETYWYVKKYLAHKIAFEEAVKGAGLVQVLTYENQDKKSLSDIAREVTVDETSLVSYNKWAKTGNIPDDRMYFVLIPVQGDQKVTIPETVAVTRVPVPEYGKEVKPSAAAYKRDEKKKINGVLVIQGLEGDNPTRLASRAGIDLSMFLKWNDLSISDRIKTGRYYFKGKKRNRAEQAYHTVAPNETLWDVSQQYGVQMKKLRRFNRLETDDVKLGMTLWLSSMKPKNSDAMKAPDAIVEVNKSDTFAWVPDASNNTALASVNGSAPTIKDSATNVMTPAVQGPVVENKIPAKVETIEAASDSAATATPLKEVVLATDTASTAKVDVVVVPEKKTEHIVQVKETLYGIARMYNIGVMDLVNWNHLNLQEGIRPGQVLRLTAPEEAQQAVATPEKAQQKEQQLEHEVKATDTLYSIARKYNVTIKDLMDWNGKKDFTLTVGEKLKIIQK